MARALIASEQQRYPWATRINDYVPVGRWRKLGLLSAGVSIVILLIGVGFLYITAQNVRHGVHPTQGTIGPLTLIVAGVFAGAAFGLALLTGVQAVVKDAKSLLVWSLAAAVPGVVALIVLFA